MKSISVAVLLLAAFFSQGAFGLASTDSDGKKCDTVDPAEKSRCLEFKQTCERMFLKPAATQYAPGSQEDSKIDIAYDDAGFQVSRTEGISPNTAVAKQVCSAELPERDNDAQQLQNLSGTCSQAKGVNNKVKCNDFQVSYDQGGSKKGMCDYIQEDFGIINTKFTHEKTACAGFNKTDRTVTSDSGPQ